MACAKDDRPIFVVGCPRSGTTLLQVMLHSHPRIAIAPEHGSSFRHIDSGFGSGTSRSGPTGWLSGSSSPDAATCLTISASTARRSSVGSPMGRPRLDRRSAPSCSPMPSVLRARVGARSGQDTSATSTCSCVSSRGRRSSTSCATRVTASPPSSGCRGGTARPPFRLGVGAIDRLHGRGHPPMAGHRHARSIRAARRRSRAGPRSPLCRSRGGLPSRDG